MTNFIITHFNLSW